MMTEETIEKAIQRAGIKKSIEFRAIEPQDNKALAGVVRACLQEFKIASPHSGYFDASTDSMYQQFASQDRSHYFVALKEGAVIGGGGIYHTHLLPWNVCEMVKFYLKPAYRGLGIGKQIAEQCFNKARALDYDWVYLESRSVLNESLRLYRKLGFYHLTSPIGDSGHTETDVWMIKPLTWS
jgi:putative acetyltransferase